MPIWVKLQRVNLEIAVRADRTIKDHRVESQNYPRRTPTDGVRALPESDRSVRKFDEKTHTEEEQQWRHSPVILPTGNETPTPRWADQTAVGSSAN